MKNNKKNIIDIYTDSNVNEILISFDNFKDFLEWNKDKEIYADRIAVNDCILMGWDELYKFKK